MGPCLTHITSPDCSYFLPYWTLIFSDVGAYIDLNRYPNVMLLLIIRKNDQTLLRCTKLLFEVITCNFQRKKHIHVFRFITNIIN